MIRATGAITRPQIATLKLLRRPPPRTISAWTSPLNPTPTLDEVLSPISTKACKYFVEQYDVLRPMVILTYYGTQYPGAEPISVRLNLSYYPNQPRRPAVTG